jgi:ribosomal protein L33
MKNMKRRFDEKTVGLDLLVHKELKLLAKEKNLQMKDLIMNIMTAYITTKNQAKNDEKMQVQKV